METSLANRPSLLCIHVFIIPGPLAVPHTHEKREVVPADPDRDPMTIVQWLPIVTRGYSLDFQGFENSAVSHSALPHSLAAFTKTFWQRE